MLKRMIGASPPQRPTDEQWLDLENVAEVELTSEDPEHPVESALMAGTGSGWRASQPGPQLIRLLFHQPLRLRRIRLLFNEERRQRTQEFVLRWSSDGGVSYREVVRQQHNFSPAGATQELEDYHVDLDGVTRLELAIIPDISRAEAWASLTQWSLA